MVGGLHWYLNRPGFWHGAINPAACWAGGALSLIESALKLAAAKILIRGPKWGFASPWLGIERTILIARVRRSCGSSR